MQTMTGSSSVANGGGAFPSTTTPPPPQQQPAGIKRKAAESHFSDELRFAKRFNLLNLDAERNRSNEHHHDGPISHPSNSAGRHAGASFEHASINRDDRMQVDDTRDRIYIHDLDEELADEEPEEEKLIFLPDIERYFSKIPQQVLQPGKDEATEGKELVLYTVPRSLSVDEEHDNVRKAIIETRQRAREKAVEDARRLDMDHKYDQSNTTTAPVETAHGYSAGYEVETHDDIDAMDIE